MVAISAYSTYAHDNDCLSSLATPPCEQDKGNLMKPFKAHRVAAVALLSTLAMGALSFVPGSFLLGSQVAGAAVPQPTTLVLNVSPNPAPSGAPVTFSATLSGGLASPKEPLGSISLGAYTDPVCHNLAFTLGVDNNVNAGNGTYTIGTTTPAAPGTYYGSAFFAASDGFNSSASSASCQPILVVNPPVVSPISVPCLGPGGGTAGLIAAVSALNSGGGGVINLAPFCTYDLASANNTVPMTGANGLPIVTNSITVNGVHTTIAVTGSNFRVFEVDGPGGNLTLNGLTLTGGNGVFAGGAILNSEGAVTLNSSQVNGNSALMGGGGIASGVVNPNDLGPIGTLTLNFSQVNNNTAQGGGGGGLLNHAGTLTANFSQVNNNTSAGGGGGIASGPANGGSAGNSNLNLYFTSVGHNTSNGGPMAGAGGVANGGSATILLSQVNGNSAPGAPGGGILNHGTMTIGLSLVNGNSAATDGMANAGNGGGIANINSGLPNSGVLTLNLSQVNGNSASGLGGGIAEVGFDQNGGLTAPGGPLTLNLSQVTGNRSSSGGGIFNTVGSPVTLKLTLIIHNSPDNCFPHGSISGCFG